MYRNAYCCLVHISLCMLHASVVLIFVPCAASYLDVCALPPWRESDLLQISKQTDILYITSVPLWAPIHTVLDLLPREQLTSRHLHGSPMCLLLKQMILLHGSSAPALPNVPSSSKQTHHKAATLPVLVAVKTRLQNLVLRHWLQGINVTYTVWVALFPSRTGHACHAVARLAILQC